MFPAPLLVLLKCILRAGGLLSPDLPCLVLPLGLLVVYSTAGSLESPCLARNGLALPERPPEGPRFVTEGQR